MSRLPSEAHTPVDAAPRMFPTPAPPPTAPTAAAPARATVLEGRPATSEDVFHRILRKLQREENFNTQTTARAASSSAQPSSGLAHIMLTGAGGRSPDDPSPHGGATTAEKMRREEEGGEEDRFGNDPAPATLRVVVDTVRTSVATKLQLATVASVKESMRLIFESRTLLDKLLKDIPLHGNLVDTAGRVRAAGGPLAAAVSGKVGPGAAKGASTTVQMKELFQEFKQQPVVLPLAKYVVNEATGKVLPQIVQRPAPINIVAGHAGLPDSASADLAASLSFDASSPRGGASRHTARYQSGTDGPRVTTTDLQAFLTQLRKQVKTADSGSQTEVTVHPRVEQPLPSRFNDVRPEEYQYQLKRVARLEVLNLEYEGIIGRLHAQLDALRGSLLRRSTAVKNLRDTLYHECTLLRTQLNQIQIKSAAQRDGTLDASLGTDYSSLHTLLDTVLLAVERDCVIDRDGRMQISSDEELRRIKLKADSEHARLKKQTIETRAKCALIVQRKTRELRSLKLANDVTKLRGVIVEQVGTMKVDLVSMKQDVANLMNAARSAIFDLAQELEYGTRRVAVEVSSFKVVRQSHRAIQDALGAADDLLSPVMKPEFATGAHPWPFARQPEPLQFFVSQTHPPDIVEAIQPELTILQHLYVQLQRFSLSMLQLPDVHRPQFGRPLVTLAHRLLASSQCSIDLLGPIRNAIDRDKYLAAQRARLNLQLKYFSFRKQTVEKLASDALMSFGLTKETPIPRSLAMRKAERGIKLAKEKKAEVEEARMQNARALYGLWRSSGIDIWGGRRAPVTRDPEVPWTPAPPMSKARRAARLQEQQQRGGASSKRHGATVEANRSLMHYLEGEDAGEPGRAQQEGGPT